MQLFASSHIDPMVTGEVQSYCTHAPLAVVLFDTQPKHIVQPYMLWHCAPVTPLFHAGGP